jgi:hypothetical protein
MNNSFKTHIWVTDNEGRGYVCTVTEDINDGGSLQSLSKDEQETCKAFNDCASRYSLENLNHLRFS